MASTPEEMKIAAWMLEEYTKRQYGLPQSMVISHIRNTYGFDTGLAVRNKRGRWALSKGILEEFGKLAPTESGIVWSRSRLLWRKRHTSDKPGRMQR